MLIDQLASKLLLGTNVPYYILNAKISSNALNENSFCCEAFSLLQSYIRDGTGCSVSLKWCLLCPQSPWPYRDRIRSHGACTLYLNRRNLMYLFWKIYLLYKFV